MFLGAAIMSFGLYQGQLKADIYDSAVYNFVQPYLVTFPGNPVLNLSMEGTAFNLTLWHQAFGTPYYKSSDITYAADTNVRIYYIGSYDEHLSPNETPKSQPTFLKTNVSNAEILAGINHLYNYKEINTGTHTNEDFETALYFEVKDVLSPGGPQYVASVNLPLPLPIPSPSPSIPNLIVDGQEFGEPYWRFYPLSSANGWTSGFNSWLGAFVCKMEPTGKNSYNIFPAWDQVEMPAYEGIYEEFVFLFNTQPIVPEPHVYLILGTLLAGIGFVAYRRQQRA